MLPLNDMLVAGISFMVDPKCSQAPYEKESYSHMASVVGRFKGLVPFGSGVIDYFYVA